MTDGPERPDFEWVHFLRLAEQLNDLVVANVDVEAQQRSAISRAYYAAFNLAKGYLESEGYGPYAEDASAHGEVKRAFNRTEDRVRKSIGQRLDALRESRNWSDYNTVVAANWSDLAKIAISRATEIEKSLQALATRQRR
jgi:uncharacterized protein (UPF0332 family)